MSLPSALNPKLGAPPRHLEQTTAPTLPPPANGKARYHWTVARLYRAFELNAFAEPERIELVGGDLWEREKVNPPHAFVTRRAARLLRAFFEPRYIVMQESPLRLATDGEPIPDLCLVTGNEDDYQIRHPTQAEAQLVIEVADATLARDTNEKAQLYAEAGIADYWVVDVNGGALWTFRNPAAADGATPASYQTQTRLQAGDTIAPLCAPEAFLAVADMLPRPVETAAQEEGEQTT